MSEQRTHPPILMICEGSGQKAHAYTIFGPGYICCMCGELVETSNGTAIAKLHTRKDILAMLDRGDFDA